MNILVLLAILLTGCLAFAQDATYTHSHVATGPDNPNYKSSPLIVKVWYTRYCEGYSYDILLVRPGQLWPTQYQSYKLPRDLSDKEQMEHFDTVSAGRALNTAYSDKLVTCSYYVDYAESQYQQDICYTILNRTDV